MNENPINESIRDNLRRKTIFPASIPENIKEEELLKNADHSGLKKRLEGEGQERKLNPEEQEVIKEYLNIAKNKLLSLGINNAEDLLPLPEQITFITGDQEIMSSGETATTEGLIVYMIGTKQNISDIETQRVFYHELSHFVAKIILKKVNGPLRMFKESQIGFQKAYTSSTQVDYKGRPRVTVAGIYEEPMADLFALYCIDKKDESYDTPYLERDIVVIAFLEEFAKRKGISAFEAFKKIFKASREMDFSFQKELVDVFGSEVVRDLNNTIHFNSAGYQALDQNYLEIAEKGGFLDSYRKLYKKFKSKQPVEFSGLPGYLVRNN